MIGVIAEPAYEQIIQEFFELFKTPWEFYQCDSEYEVLLCAGGVIPSQVNSRLVIHYTAGPSDCAFPHEYIVADSAPARVAVYQKRQLPLYNESVTFRTEDFLTLHDDASRQPLAGIIENNHRKIVTIGYQLFREVEFLLRQGQPETHAIIPTLDLHIALLRDLIVGQGIELIEIPPAPMGYPFIACLTHDVDHPMLKAHLWDRTALGLGYRALYGSLVNFLQSRITSSQFWRNLRMVGSLPLIWLGARKDPWAIFAESYKKLEGELPSTYYFLPFKAYPGRTQHRLAPSARAAKYRAADLTETIRKILSDGNEVGLHGIDAWIDPETGFTELQEIRRLTGTANPGVRMHWLYFDQNSPQQLEKAGAAYDSTAGYNGAVGYRAGTTQAYVPPSVDRLMELPLHIMDTALFYPSHMHLTQEEAEEWIDRIIDHAHATGGCITINWHDRSLFPERQWEAAYRMLIKKLRDRDAWFATASQAVAWFRQRRAVTLAHLSPENKCAISEQDSVPNLPELRLRIWNHSFFKAQSGSEHPTHFDMSLQAYLAMSQTDATG